MQYRDVISILKMLDNPDNVELVLTTLLGEFKLLHEHLNLILQLVVSAFKFRANGLKLKIHNKAKKIHNNNTKSSKVQYC